jgi:hypothetical protein
MWSKIILLGIAGLWHRGEAFIAKSMWGVTGGPAGYRGLDCGSNADYFRKSAEHSGPNPRRRYWKRQYDNSPIKINVIVSVIAGGSVTKGFDRRTAESWISLLNQAYGNFNIFFYLFNFHLINNPQLTFRYPGQEDPLNLFGNRDHKTLHVVVAENITSSDGDDGIRGVATFPWDFTPNLAQGVFIKAEAMPPHQYSTLPHEVGHWMGLVHTFNNGCPKVPVENVHFSHHSDYVRDTTIADEFKQKPAWNGDCPANDIPFDALCVLPSASRQKFVFENYPVYNYMSYTAPSCRSEFTRGQGMRMRAMWAWREHRNGPAKEDLF